LKQIALPDHRCGETKYQSKFLGLFPRVFTCACASYTVVHAAVFPRRFLPRKTGTRPLRGESSLWKASKPVIRAGTDAVRANSDAFDKLTPFAKMPIHDWYSKHAGKLAGEVNVSTHIAKCATGFTPNRSTCRSRTFHVSRSPALRKSGLHRSFHQI